MAKRCLQGDAVLDEAAKVHVKQWKWTLSQTIATQQDPVGLSKVMCAFRRHYRLCVEWIFASQKFSNGWNMIYRNKHD